MSRSTDTIWMFSMASLRSLSNLSCNSYCSLIAISRLSCTAWYSYFRLPRSRVSWRFSSEVSSRFLCKVSLSSAAALRFACKSSFFSLAASSCACKSTSSDFFCFWIFSINFSAADIPCGLVHFREYASIDSAMASKLAERRSSIAFLGLLFWSCFPSPLKPISTNWTQNSASTTSMSFCNFCSSCRG